MRIIPLVEAAEQVAVTESGQYATLSYRGAELVIPTLPRPGNHSESIYLVDGALQFVPGGEPVLAAVFASRAGETTLTLFPLPLATQPEEA